MRQTKKRAKDSILNALTSAGVALASMYPEGKNAIAWVRGGWHVTLAYVIGFAVMLAVLGWFPQPKHEAPRTAAAIVAAPSAV